MQQGARIPPFFIVGCGRSGSTMLRLMLDKHSDIYIPTESNFIPILHDYWKAGMNDEALDTFVKWLRSIPSPPMEPVVENIGWDSPGLERYIYENRNVNFADLVYGIYSHGVNRNGKKMWGDKTPSNVAHLPLLKSLFPGCKIIHLVRDGRDVGLSFVKFNYGPNNLKEAAIYWHHRITQFRKFQGKYPGENCFQVKYEDLVTDPETWLGKICGFLNVQFEPDMLLFHESARSRFHEDEKFLGHELVSKPVTKSRVGIWKSEMSDRDLAIFEAISGDFLSEFGYEKIAYNGSHLGARLRAKLSLKRFQLASNAKKLKNNLKRVAKRVVRHRLRG